MGDGLPAQLCLQCVHQISRCHAFKDLVERNDITLREHANWLAEEALKRDREEVITARERDKNTLNVIITPKI